MTPSLFVQPPKLSHLPLMPLPHPHPTLCSIMTQAGDVMQQVTSISQWGFPAFTGCLGCWREQSRVNKLERDSTAAQIESTYWQQVNTGVWWGTWGGHRGCVKVTADGLKNHKCTWAALAEFIMKREEMSFASPWHTHVCGVSKVLATHMLQKPSTTSRVSPN